MKFWETRINCATTIVELKLYIMQSPLKRI